LTHADAQPPTGGFGVLIVTFLRDRATRPLTSDQLAKELEIGVEDSDRFREELQELAADGVLFRSKRGTYAIPARLSLAVGPLQVTRAGHGFVSVEDPGKDVFIPSGRLSSAVAGDTVVARIEKRRPGRNPEGCVIRVLRRARKQLVGIYHRRRTHGFVTPQEPKLRRDVFLSPGNEGPAEDGDVVVVEVLDWGEGELGPTGKITRVLGGPGDPGVDVLAVVFGYDLPGEFPERVLKEAERIAARGIRPEDLDGREDLRGELCFTIDPAEARDHDDALSVRELPNGRHRVGVHIADVSTYVVEGGELDREARERGTSVYLVDRVIPMLPEPLSAGLCSLVPGEDRLAVSVLFTLGSSGGIESHRLVRSVIRSHHRLSYDQAQEMLDDPDGARDAKLSDALQLLDRLAHTIRDGRQAAGGLDFDLPESRVVLNGIGEPTEITRVLRLGAHRLVEDLMILANETVARLALRKKIPLIFRVHEEPEPDKLESLRELAAAFGHALPRRRIRPLDLSRMLARSAGTPAAQILSGATLRSMKQARYAAENCGHFGLASKAYAHFTSPIRRYPDLVVHRQLSRWMDGDSFTEEETVSLAEVATQASQRERLAVQAERDSVELKKVEFMERHVGDEFPGTISGVTAFGLFVLLDDIAVDGLVHIGSLGDDYYVYQEERHALVGRRRRRRFQLGDAVRVRLVRVDREARRMDLELVSGTGGA